MNPNRVWWIGAGELGSLQACETGRYGALSDIEASFDCDVECDLAKWIPEAIYPLPESKRLRYAPFFDDRSRELCPVRRLGGGELIAFLIRSAG